MTDIFHAGLQWAEAFGKSAGAVTICQYIGAGAGSEGSKASVGFEKGGSIASGDTSKKGSVCEPICGRKLEFDD